MEFHPQSNKPYDEQNHLDVLLNIFHLNSHTRVSSTDFKFLNTLFSILNSIT